MADYIHPDSIEYKLNLGRVPPEPQEGVIWRGMSGGEYKNLLEQGFLESKGDYNIGEIQKGLTIFSSNPRTAEMYAHDFAPREFKATPESSAYVVGIRKPSGAVPQTQKNPSEFGVTGQIPIEDIVSVYRGNVFRPRSDRQRAVLDWQEMSLPERRLPQDEPRSTDLIPLATPPEEEEHKPGLPRLTGIGQVFRGIGSMIGGPKLRAVRKLITMAQQGYELLPEEQKILGDVLDMEALTKQIPGTGKGVDYFRQLLGMGPEEGGIISLQDLREPVPVYQSAVARAVDALPMDKGPGEQMLAMVSKSSGVKPEEIEWTGLAGFLKDKKSVTKQEIQDFISANQLRINEIVRSEGAMTDAFESSFAEGSIDPGPNRQPIFEEHTLPGGENYREVAFTTGPEKAKGLGLPEFLIKDADGVLQLSDASSEAEAVSQAGGDRSRVVLRGFDLPDDPNFRGSHLEIPNTLFHVRLNDRIGPNGEKILFVEEWQSDWHRKGRELGYKDSPQFSGELSATKQMTETGPYWEITDENGKFVTNVVGDLRREIDRDLTEAEAIAEARWRMRLPSRPSESGIASDDRVPDAPLKKTWYQTAFRRIARMAAEEGYDSVAWTPGEVQADRYNLRKRVSEIRYVGTNLKVYGLDGETVLENTGVKHEDLPDIIGRQAAKRLLAQTPDAGLRSLVGEELEIGGEELKSLYDEMIKNYAKKFGKKFGAKVGTTRIIAYDTGVDWYKIGNDVMEYLGIPSPERAEYWRNLTVDQRAELMEQYSKRGGGTEVWNLPITPKMREHLLRKGISTFAQGGFIDKPLYDRSL
jgi:hypothetical protein